MATETHPPVYWSDASREHAQRGESDLARLCAEAADSARYREHIAGAARMGPREVTTTTKTHAK